jgi:hypothetical protein
VCSVEQRDGGDKLECGEEVAGELVVAGCDGPEVFELVKEALDEVAFAVEGEVALSRGDAIGLGRDDRSDAARLQGQDQGVGVIGLVGQEGSRTDPGQQRLGLAKIGGLAGGQGDADRIAQGVDDNVDLGGQSASGAADGLVAVFFRAPALCW